MADDAKTKACPWCGQTILAVARKCKHCRAFLNDAGPASGPKTAASKHPAASHGDETRAAGAAPPRASKFGEFVASRRRAPRPSAWGVPEPRRRVVVGLVALVVAAAIIVVATNLPDSGTGVVNTSGRGNAVLIPQGDLGSEAGGTRWRAVQGEWQIIGATLTILSLNASSSALAITDGLPGSSVVKVKMRVTATGSGIIFRYLDPLNFWSLVAVPSDATWNLTKVISGKRTGLGSTGLSAVANGTVIAVSSRDDGVIGVFINGRPVLTVRDLALVGQARAGLGAFGPGSEHAMFQAFETLPTLPA